MQQAIATTIAPGTAVRGYIQHGGTGKPTTGRVGLDPHARDGLSGTKLLRLDDGRLMLVADVVELPEDTIVVGDHVAWWEASGRGWDELIGRVREDNIVNQHGEEVLIVTRDYGPTVAVPVRVVRRVGGRS